MKDKMKNTMQSLKVALMQLQPGMNLQENLQKGLQYCRMAKQMGADIALFPEMWSVGYHIPTEKAVLKDWAVSLNSEFVCAFERVAKELDMAIGITFLEAYEPLPRNTLCLFDRFGENILTYAKVHTCDFGDECRLSPGEDFYVSTLDTIHGPVKIGAMICFDREFPESARILMLKGAEVILVPNACPMEINRLAQLRARAYENMVGIATANYPGSKVGCNGHSSAFDGIAYCSSDGESRDMLLLEAGEDEGIYMADFPLESLRAYRKCEVHGNAYRHPQKYRALVAAGIEEPFIRKDYRK